MAALSLAIIGKNNEPLYVKVFERTGLNGNASEEALFGLPNLADEMETGDEETHSPRHLFMIHAALDRIEQLAGPPPGYGWRRAGVASGRDSMFVGLLAPIEDMRIYGYITTTKIKFILVVEDEGSPDVQRSMDDDVKSLLFKIHGLYVDDLMNPFKEIGSSIVSKGFNEKLLRYVAAFNQADNMI